MTPPPFFSSLLLPCLLLLCCSTYSFPFEFPSQNFSGDFCQKLRSPPQRAYNASLTDFGGVGDGQTLNTQAFRDAVAFLGKFSGRGGALLYIPAGKWLTGCFNLTSHFTLFLHRNATIVGSQDPKQWPIIDPLPSYGRGRELPGGRHMSLIHGENLTDVVITGDNGTVDGQGDVWWKLFANGSLDYTRGHLVELMHSRRIVISSLTFVNSPFWNIHPVYCSNVLIQNLTILAPIQSANTDGIDPDSSKYVCIEDCYIENGDDLISIKSGWDEYGIAYGRPSSHIVIQRISGSTRSSSGVSFGSEMSGGISDVHVTDVVLSHGNTGVRVKSAPGRGGYVKNIYVSNIDLHNVKTAISLTTSYGQHPDDNYDPNALPDIRRIFIENMMGQNITMAGDFQGLSQEPFRKIYLRNITLHLNSTSEAWNCSYVKGYADLIFPKICSQFSAVKWNASFLSSGN